MPTRPRTLIDVLKEIQQLAKNAASPPATLGELVDNVATADGDLTVSVAATATATSTLVQTWGSQVWDDSHYTWG